MNLPVIIIGGGGHAKVLIEALTLTGVEIVGLADPDTDGAKRRFPGVSVLGGDEALNDYGPDTVALINGVGDMDRRRMIFEREREKGFRFAPVVHPSAIVASDAVIGEGAQIMAGTVIQSGTTIGANAVINTSASVDHDCIIGEHTHIAPGAVLSGAVKVGAKTLVGAGATIIQNVEIGAGCVIAAGAVVIDPVAPGTTVTGVPARERD